MRDGLINLVAVFNLPATSCAAIIPRASLALLLLGWNAVLSYNSKCKTFLFTKRLTRNSESQASSKIFGLAVRCSAQFDEVLC